VDTFEHHLANLLKVFDLIKHASLKLQPHKCHLLQPQVQFLGHIVTANGVSPDPEKSKKVKELLVQKLLGWLATIVSH